MLLFFISKNCCWVLHFLLLFCTKQWWIPIKKGLFVYPKEIISNKKSSRPAAVGWFKASSSIIVAVRYLVSYLYRKPVLAEEEKREQRVLSWMDQNLCSSCLQFCFMMKLPNSFRNWSLTINLVLLFIDMAKWKLFLLFWGQCSSREDHLDINT